MDLDEIHRAAVAEQDGECGGAQMTAVQRMRIARGRRDGWWPAAASAAEAVNDVLRVEARPHDDPELGELGADFAELIAERTLGVVELGGLREQRRAFRVEGRETFRTVRDAPVAGGIANGRHENSPRAWLAGEFGGGGRRRWSVCPALRDSDPIDEVPNHQPRAHPHW